MHVGDLKWLDAFPALAEIDDAAWHEAARSAKKHKIRAGGALFAQSDLNRSFLLLQRGHIRLYKVAESGREIMLYRLNPGEICLFNALSSLLGRPLYATTAIAEDEVHLMSISPQQFNQAFIHADAFREYVLTRIGQRLSDVMQRFEEVRCKRLDLRLAQLLLELSRADLEGRIRTTHNELATELDSSREVVSRLLKDFQQKGWVEQRRAEIRVLALDEMHRYVKEGLFTRHLSVASA